jgi:hypothetical protein
MDGVTRRTLLAATAAGGIFAAATTAGAETSNRYRNPCVLDMAAPIPVRVGQYVTPSWHPWQRLHQEVGCTHPVLVG